ncbi:hypothetical protein V8G54_015151 [Vigna mungo]|uniref:Uncharacterized protein n=1 Tax=Vigna mungo TaxID=3915 RepID=A0AAQ3RZX6_VIGMU
MTSTPTNHSTIYCPNRSPSSFIHQQTQPNFFFFLFTFLHVLPQAITNYPSPLSNFPNTIILLKIQRPPQSHNHQQVKVHHLLITLSSFMASSSSPSPSPHTITKQNYHNMPRIRTILLHLRPPLALQPRTPPTLSQP